jgi:nucleoside-diphosphate-sugar epimerase
MMTNYMVTGGSGFIGSRIVRNLVQEGDSVVVYDWLPVRSNLERFLSEKELQNKVKIIHGDITDYSLLIRTLKENNIDKIVHMAGLLIHEVNANPLLGARVNIEGTISVFEAARFLGLKKVVWASSGSVFGPAEMYTQEYIPADAPHFPQNIYGATKSFDELIMNYYNKTYKTDITAVRYVMVYGAGQSRGRTAGIMQQLVINPALGKPGKVPAASWNVLGWTYVEDAAEATVLAVKSASASTRAYSIMGEIHSVQEIADYVKKLIPDADITLLPLERSVSHTGVTCKYDTRLTEDELGFHSEWTMERGIKDTINTVRREHSLPPV